MLALPCEEGANVFGFRGAKLVEDRKCFLPAGRGLIPPLGPLEFEDGLPEVGGAANGETRASR